MATTSSTKINETLNKTNVAENKASEGKFSNDLRSTVGEIVGEENLNKVSDFAGRAQEGVSALKDRAQHVAGQVQETASEYVDNASEYLRKYPIQSVLAGFGVGLLIGALLSPRRLA